MAAREVFLSEYGDRAPEPVNIVRLLVTSQRGAIFCAPRGERPGLDLPSAVVADGEPLAAALNRLVHDVFGAAAPTRSLGHVRNTVPVGTTYEWPTPVAHFTVHHAMTTLEPKLEGTWLRKSETVEQLSDRHWWPIVTMWRERLYLAVVERRANDVVDRADEEGWLTYLESDEASQTPLQKSVNALARTLRVVHHHDDGCVS